MSVYAMIHAAAKDFCSLENLTCWHVFCFHYHSTWILCVFPHSSPSGNDRQQSGKVIKVSTVGVSLPSTPGEWTDPLRLRTFNPSRLALCEVDTLGNLLRKRVVLCWKYNTGRIRGHGAGPPRNIVTYRCRLV